MPWHPLLALACRLHRVVGALEVGALLGLYPLQVLRPVGPVIQALLGDLLRLRFPLAAPEAGATPTAVEWRANLPRAVDVASLSLDGLFAVGAPDPHTFPFEGERRQDWIPATDRLLESLGYSPVRRVTPRRPLFMRSPTPTGPNLLEIARTGAWQLDRRAIARCASMPRYSRAPSFSPSPVRGERVSFNPPFVIAKAALVFTDAVLALLPPHLSVRAHPLLPVRLVVCQSLADRCFVVKISKRHDVVVDVMLHGNLEAGCSGRAIPPET